MLNTLKGLTADKMSCMVRHFLCREKVVGHSSTVVQLVRIPSKMIEILRKNGATRTPTVTRRICCRCADGVKSATSPIAACQNWTFRNLKNTSHQGKQGGYQAPNQGRFVEYFKFHSAARGLRLR